MTISAYITMRQSVKLWAGYFWKKVSLGVSLGGRGGDMVGVNWTDKKRDGFQRADEYLLKSMGEVANNIIRREIC